MGEINYSGFYKEIEGKWFYAPNNVYNSNYTLYRQEKDTYSYPIDGWVWHDDNPSGFTQEIIDNQ